MAFAKVAEVAGPTNCPGEEIALHGGNVEKVINGTHEGDNPSGGTVGVGNFVRRVCEDWWSDVV